MTTPLGASVDSDAGGNGALPGTRFIDPAALARIGNLELVARWVVEGFLSGLHRSPHLGFSTDFAEHRQYVPGDDIRRIDWRVFARTERYYVKEYEADTNTNFMVLLDVSKSMQYGSGPLSKLEYAKYLAACLTYFSHRQRDRVGLISFDDDVRAFVPPSAKHLQQVLHELDRATPLGKGSLARPLAKVAESQRRRGVMLVLSPISMKSQTASFPPSARCAMRGTTWSSCKSSIRWNAALPSTTQRRLKMSRRSCGCPSCHREFGGTTNA